MFSSSHTMLHLRERQAGQDDNLLTRGRHHLADALIAAISLEDLHQPQFTMRSLVRIATLLAATALVSAGAPAPQDVAQRIVNQVSLLPAAGVGVEGVCGP
jgi:hypothetical protein